MSGALRRLASLLGLALAPAACALPHLRELVVERVAPHPQGDAAVLVVFSTATDLASYLPRHEATVKAETRPCTLQPNDTRRIAPASWVTTEDGMFILDARVVTGPTAVSPGPDGRFRFSFRLNLSNAFHFQHDSTAGARLLPWDLRRDTDDICFRIQGGRMFGRHRSPEFRLPYAAIAEALRGLPPAAPP